MTHLDSRELDLIVTDSAAAARKTLRHVDACVVCRRAYVERGGSGTQLSRRLARTRLRRPALATAVAIAVVALATAAVAPLRGAAASMLATFEPQRVTAIPVTLEDMRSLRAMPDLMAYATTRDVVRSEQADFRDARAASSAARFAIREPSAAIPGLRPLSYSVQGSSAELVTFNAASRARGLRSEAASLPPDIAGTTLRIELRPVVLATYDTAAAAAERQHLLDALGRAHFFGPPAQDRTRHAVEVTRSAASHMSYFLGRGSRGASFDMTGLPLVVAQMPVPHVSSTGASVQRLVSYMLAAPGVSPRLAASFRALGDLSTTLPIPVPIDKAYTQPVAVDGVVGVGLGDDTGIGAAVIWQKNGMLYAVLAPRTARDVLAIADSLR